MDYIITDHAKERYAERIADREGNCDIKQYVARNDEKITKDINKMMERADFIAQGKFGKGYSPVKVYICGLWVFLVDIEEPRIITLYNIDLGVGEELNKEYMKRSREKIGEAKAQYDATVADTKEYIAGLEDYIAANNETIAEYKAAIKDLEKLNEDTGATIRDSKARNRAAELNLCKAIESLITKRVF